MSKAGAPLTFKAGGKTTGPSSGKRKNSNNGDTNANHPASSSPSTITTRQPSSPPSPPPPPSITQPNLRDSSSMRTILQTGLSHKRSPLQLKNWIACVLTLDGRDKFTKVLQYTSRLLCWYLAGLAKRQTSAIGGGTGAAVSSAVTAGAAAASSSHDSFLNTLGTVLAHHQLRQKFYEALSQRFNALYKSLVTSRKAFRLGRTFIEIDKLKSMGWGYYLSYMMTHPLAGCVANDWKDGHGTKEQVLEMQGNGGDNAHANDSTLTRYDTHPILEEDEEDNDSDDEESSWNEESVEEDGDEEEKKMDPPPPLNKAVSRPGRPKLPTRISSNVGWGPSTTSKANVSADSSSPTNTSDTMKYSSIDKPANHPPPPARTVSEMGRQMYQPFPSRSSSMGSYKQLKEETEEGSSKSPSSSTPPPPTLSAPPTPAWKLIGSTMKLLGLMGFWTFDNLAFLTGSGFLDPIRLQQSGDGASSSAAGAATKNVNKHRLERKKRASEWGARCYFLGCMGGLYVNMRSFYGHRYGALKDARDRLAKAIHSRDNNNNNNNDNSNSNNIKEAQYHLKRTEQKHFELFLALLKSCCDVVVFSNNPGIDLHLKLRGKKNHEGLHCLGGLVSAGTVLYNNFPNAS
eukprot:CAMPEP_0183709748 /NCGR_PEP_ID=MMETSP0737-20130205/5722_1 /TAXON_ID=385413 /ORGANISM="Thalassiosira miniscula, Strain CCMP1093" /LENGTH=627 /DNA_ID=CAMNT_0025937927 /DNA_START=167 /DNA_END=2050 /DNA_ORIENTATION=+